VEIQKSRRASVEKDRGADVRLLHYNKDLFKI
jgi:hypothetical protein